MTGAASVEVVIDFIDARRDERRLKRAIDAWFEEQARMGKLVAASQAPMWVDYKAARDRYHSALARLDEEIAP